MEKEIKKMGEEADKAKLCGSGAVSVAGETGVFPPDAEPADRSDRESTGPAIKNGKV